jgi:Zn-dependent protease
MVMTTFRDFLSKFRHYFRFSKEEIEACVISVLALAFIVSFDEWGYGDKFDFNVGLSHFLSAIVIVGIVLGLQIVVTKIQALQWGFRAEYKLWWYGIIIGLGVAFFSGTVINQAGGAFIIWFLAPGGIFFHHMSYHRLGWFRYGVNLTETALCCLLGSLSSIALAIVIKLLLYIFPESLFLYKFLVVSLWLAFFSILPIPPLNGSRIFFWSRIAYPMLLGGIIGASILLRTPLSIFWTIVCSLLLGVIFWALNLWKIEGRV